MSTAKLEKKLAKLEVKLRAEFQADVNKACFFWAAWGCIAIHTDT